MRLRLTRLPSFASLLAITFSALALLSCAVDEPAPPPGPALGEPTLIDLSSPLMSTDGAPTADDPRAACYAYCADGHFYCPPNPAMECYWVCTRYCPIEPGCFECFDV